MASPSLRRSAEAERRQERLTLLYTAGTGQNSAQAASAKLRQTRQSRHSYTIVFIANYTRYRSCTNTVIQGCDYSPAKGGMIQ